MRGNNKRKLMPESLLSQLLDAYRLGVPLAKLIREHDLDISRPHLRKLLFIYIDVLEEEAFYNKESTLRHALFPAWVREKQGITIQPDKWTFTGRFPLGAWGVKQ